MVFFSVVFAAVMSVSMTMSVSVVVVMSVMMGGSKEGFVRIVPGHVGEDSVLDVPAQQALFGQRQSVLA